MPYRAKINAADVVRVLEKILGFFMRGQESFDFKQIDRNHHPRLDREKRWLRDSDMIVRIQGTYRWKVGNPPLALSFVHIAKKTYCRLTPDKVLALCKEGLTGG